MAGGRGWQGDGGGRGMGQEGGVVIQRLIFLPFSLLFFELLPLPSWAFFLSLCFVLPCVSLDPQLFVSN